MKVIGFANKYYTLWEVTENTYILSDGHKRVHTMFSYIKNISFDKNIVLEKYPNVPFDESLRGHIVSFENEKEVWENVDVYRFGKYKYEKIGFSNDINYTAWYWENIPDGEHKDYVSDYLKKNGYEIRNNTYTNYNGEVISSEYLVSPDEIAEELAAEEKQNEIIKKLQNNEVLTINPNSNIDSDGIWFEDNNILYKFPGVAEYYYQGYPYYLPVLNGKSKRIKNKNVEINKYTFEKTENDKIIINIINFNILK